MFTLEYCDDANSITLPGMVCVDSNTLNVPQQDLTDSYEDYCVLETYGFTRSAFQRIIFLNRHGGITDCYRKGTRENKPDGKYVFTGHDWDVITVSK